jgi:transcriptional regulator NrdR family protein
MKGKLGVLCPKCGSENSSTKDSRPHYKSVKRRRKCLDCGHTYLTIENNPDDGIPTIANLKIKARDGVHEYDRQKVRAMINNRCIISSDKLNESLYYVEKLLFACAHDRNVSDKIIDYDEYSDIVETVLLYSDWRAFVSYEAVKSSLKNLVDFSKTLIDRVHALEHTDYWKLLSSFSPPNLYDM